jgi:N-acetylglucosaminyl-diphospho-decaprenol L-rhamnosyltransferase
MAEVRLSVVTVSWNTGPHLMECVRSVLAAPGVDELILVSHENDAQTVADLQNLARKNKKFLLVETGENLGFSKGCNIGAERASGELVLFLNPDAVLISGVASQLKASAAQMTVRPFVIGGRVINEDGTEQRGGRRGALTPWSAFVSFLGLHNIFSSVHSIHRETNRPCEALCEVPTVSGAALMMRRDDFYDVGQFDERYFLHVEDIDICRMVRDRGGEVWHDPHAGIRHYGGTSQASPLFVEGHKAAGFVKYFLKFYPGPIERLTTYVLAPAFFAALWGRVLMISAKAWIASVFRKRDKVDAGDTIPHAADTTDPAE